MKNKSLKLIPMLVALLFFTQSYSLSLIAKVNVYIKCVKFFLGEFEVLDFFMVKRNSEYSRIALATSAA